jgi:hypothetical protein
MAKLLTLVGLLSFAAATIVSLSKNEYPSKLFWGGRLAYLLFGCTVVTLVAPHVQTFLANAGEKKRRRELERERSYREILTSTLVAVVDASGADWTRTAVQVFLVRRHLRWKSPFLVEQQDRIARVKLSFSPPPSGIRWTRGKGVIGRCWEARDNIIEDLRVRFGPYIDYTREQWDALDGRDRFGLDFEEFQRTRTWYGIVGAAPILDPKGRFLGCVSLDTPQTCPDVVDKDGLGGLLRVAAVVIEQMLAGSR